MLQLVRCQGVVIRLLLENGLAEVLCNVVHCLSDMSVLSAKSAVDAVYTDVELLFCTVARITFW